jgi:23S rRNA (guanosine2251-2'-O)-methyltransferase
MGNSCRLNVRKKEREVVLIHGIHSVKSALLSSGSQRVKILYMEQGKNIHKLTGIPPNSNFISTFDIEILSQNEMRDMLGKGAVHQGIAADVTLNIFRNIEDLRDSEDDLIAILDSVTDPHNLGAVIRSAACFGVRGIIIPENSSSKITGITAKAASGALEHVFVYFVKNLSQTIKKLKDFGFWIISMSEKGECCLDQLNLRGRIAVILGSEGAGIRRLQLENSDFIAKLPTTNTFNVLNISNAASVAFYILSKSKN